MKRYSTLIVLTGLCCLTGCVSQPKRVNATLPLVNASQFSHLPDQSRELRENKAKAIPELNIKQGKTIIEGTEYQVSNAYMSALGTSCFAMNAVDDSSQGTSLVLCQKQNYWLLFPSLTNATVQ